MKDTTKEQAQEQINKMKSELARLEQIVNAPIDIIDRVKSYEDACEVLGIKPLTQKDFNFLSEKQRVAMFASHKIQIIADALNQGWEPNWSDGNERKWYPYFNMAGSVGFSLQGTLCVFWYSYAFVGSRFCFKNEKTARYAGDRFLDLYRAMMIIE